MILGAGVLLLKLAAHSIYAPMKLLPVKHKLVLISRLNSTTSIDFQHIINEARRANLGIHIVVLNHKMNNRLLHVFAILREMYHLATAEACVVESYVISISILRHRPSLVIVQIWHALGAIKNFGHSAIGRREGSSLHIATLMNMHKNYTYVTTGSSVTTPIYAEAFNIPAANIQPIGMPRVDYLLDSHIKATNIQKITDYYHIPPAKKVILYAPTFRKGLKIPYDQLIKAVDLSRYTLIIKQHPLDKTTITPHEGVLVDRSFSVLALLAVADYVVTDYSAVVFEAALMNKALFFWLYDVQRYSKRRGFAMNYRQELPGLQDASIAKIVAAIEHDDYDQATIRSFAQRYITTRDGSCTRRLFELMGLHA